MKKTLIFLGMTALVFSFATLAHAEDANIKASLETKSVKVNGDIRLNATKIGQDIENRIETGREEMRNIASTTRANIEIRREEMKNTASTTKQTVEMKRAQIQDEINTRKQDLETKASEVKTRVQTNIFNRISETIKNIGTRFENEIRRLHDIKARIDSRLAKFEGAGVDTTLARADLVTASAKIDAVGVSASALGSIAISTSTPMVSTDSLRQAIKSVQGAIQEAQKSLMNVVSDMRGYEATLKARGTATTSASNQ